MRHAISASQNQSFYIMSGFSPSIADPDQRTLEFVLGIVLSLRARATLPAALQRCEQARINYVNRQHVWLQKGTPGALYSVEHCLMPKKTSGFGAEPQIEK